MPPTPIMTTPKGPSLGGIKPRMGFFARLSTLWTIFMFLFVFSIVVMAVVVSVQNKDISYGIKYLGNKTITVTDNLNTESLKIIEQQGIYVKGNSFASNSWNFLKSIWNFLVAFFMIYLWIKVLSWIFLHIIIQDNDKTTASFILAVFLFLGIQILFITIFTDSSPMTPINSFINFVKSLQYIFSPIINMVKT